MSECSPERERSEKVEIDSRPCAHAQGYKSHRLRPVISHGLTRWMLLIVWCRTQESVDHCFHWVSLALIRG